MTPAAPGSAADALTDLCAPALGIDELPQNRGEKATMTATAPFDAIRQQLGEGILDSGVAF
jgi:hypothetical protein